MREGQKFTKGLNILCIDGGGTHGLSSLFVIKELTNRLHGMEQGKTSSKPADHFDVIAGTGPGGIIACMLGRLEMSIEDAIAAYLTLAKHAFSKKYISAGRPTAFRATKLQEALSSMVLAATGSETEMMKVDGPGGSACKTMVFAMSSHNMTGSIPVIFRSYDTSVNISLNCTIWEALYATMAHPDLFKAIYITDGLISQSFIGGELGCSNPTAHVLDEIKNIHPGRHVSCIISVGVGITHLVRIPDPSPSERILRIPTGVVGGIKNMSADSERVAEEMAARFKHTQSVYYRFNVDQGMQTVEDDWEEQPLVMAHTTSYMKKGETSQKLSRAAETAKERKPVLSVKCVDGSIQTPPEQTITTKSCPMPTPVFTGRDSQLQQIGNCIVVSTRERRVCVVHGMGGAGKTQVILKVIEQNRETWKHILYVDAISKEAIESALGDFAKAKGFGKTFEDALNWLMSCHQPWLLVFDNADHPSLDIHHYFPRGNHGSILITTRLPALGTHAHGPKSVCHVSEMSEADALALFFRVLVARIRVSDVGAGEMEAAHALLKDFGYLALAIVQAGAYIAYSLDISISQYRKLFLERKQQMLEQYIRLGALVKLDDYRRSVYATFKLCYDLLREDGGARPTLWLISYLHYGDIRHDIFQRAALQIRSYKPQFQQNAMEQEAYQYLQWYLGRFLDSGGNWDATRFSNVMNELASYSLVEFDSVNQAYRMHVLTQECARTSNPQRRELALECSTLLLWLSVDWSNTVESTASRRKLRRHLEIVIPKETGRLSANHAWGFAQVYVENGNWDQAQELQTYLVQAVKQQLGEEHPLTLMSVNDLANTYRFQGQWDEAQPLHEQVLDGCRRVLGEEHPLTLRGMNSLAVTYQSQGRWSEAQGLHERVLCVRKRVLGEMHPHTLGSMNNLALTYQYRGQWDKAQSLQEQVLSAHKLMLQDGHPDTLRSMNNLALTYESRSEWDKAQSLQEQVLATQKRVLGKEHPHTLGSMNNLALTYQSRGQLDEAQALHERALNAQMRVLGEGHPDTLSCMNNLANTYQSQGLWDKAQSLHERVLDAYRRVLSEEHPDTLTSMSNLANTYQSQGHSTEAVSLHEQALNARKQVLGAEHPHTLMSMNKLSFLYAQLGQFEKSEQLAAAVDARKHVVGEQHHIAVWARNHVEWLQWMNTSNSCAKSDRVRP